MTVWVVEATLSSGGPCQFFQVPYTALTMILTPSPRERDSATAYRESNSVFARKLLSPSPCSLPCQTCTCFVSRDDHGDGRDTDGSHCPWAPRVQCPWVSEV